MAGAGHTGLNVAQVAVGRAGLVGKLAGAGIGQGNKALIDRGQSKGVYGDRFVRNATRGQTLADKVTLPTRQSKLATAAVASKATRQPSAGKTYDMLKRKPAVPSSRATAQAVPAKTAPKSFAAHPKLLQPKAAYKAPQPKPAGGKSAVKSTAPKPKAAASKATPPKVNVKSIPIKSAPKPKAAPRPAPRKG